jgi:hypothetical protein
MTAPEVGYFVWVCESQRHFEIGNLESGKFLHLKSKIPKISNWTAATVAIRID